MPDWMFKLFKYFVYPVAIIYRYTFHAYRFITGKGSGSYAWGICAISASYTLTRDYMHHFFWLITALHIAFIAFTISVTYHYNRYVSILPKDTELVLFTWTPICIGLAVGEMLCFYGFILIERGLGFQCLLNAIWCMSATVYRPGGKSIFSKAKAKLKEMAANRKPVLAPMPV